MSQPLLERDHSHACCEALGATRVQGQVFLALGFLEWQRIHSTAPLLERYEERARRNLETAIAALQQEDPS